MDTALVHRGRFFDGVDLRTGTTLHAIKRVAITKGNVFINIIIDKNQKLNDE